VVEGLDDLNGDPATDQRIVLGDPSSAFRTCFSFGRAELWPISMNTCNRQHPNSRSR
jgi:hypothetical protein